MACDHLQSDLKLTLYLTNRLFSVSFDCKHLREHFVFLPQLLAFLSKLHVHIIALLQLFQHDRLLIGLLLKAQLQLVEARLLGP